MKRHSSDLKTRHRLSISLLAGAFVCLGFAFSSVANAATYYSDYGQNRTHSVAVAVGSHNFQVNGISANKNTEWYIDGVYAGSSANDWSGTLAIDPEYTKYVSGNVQIKALIYDRYWNYEEYHTWNVSVARPDLIVQDISISPTSPTAGQSATITATLKNQGNASASGSIRLKYYIDGSYIGDDYLSYGLGAGSSNNESISYTEGSAGNHTIKIVIDTENSVSESNESNNDRSEMYYWNSPPKPDLIVQDISISPTSPTAGQSATITATLKNQGNASASGSIRLKYYIDGSYIGDDYLSYGLGAGSSNNESISYTEGSAGNHTIKIVIDTENSVSESNESNNDRSEMYYWNSPPKPDLIVQDIWTEPSSVVEGQNFKIKATIKNQGNGTADAGLFANQEALFYLDGVKYGEGDDYDNLAPGATITVESVNITGPSAGSHSIKVKADGNSEVSESNEGNNERTESVTVQSPPKPDLIVQDIWTEPSSVVEGQNFKIKATIKNQGDGAADAGLFANQEALFYLDNVKYGEGDDYDNLAPGATITVESVNITGPSAGSHSIKVKADGNSEVSESNEGNNERTESVTAQPPPMPDLIVQSVTGTTSSYNTGQKINASAVVKNQGKSAAGTSKVKYFLGTSSNKTYHYIEQGNIGSLSVNATESDMIGNYITGGWTIPSEIPQGTYYIWVQADSSNTVNEGTEEGNNWNKSSSFSIVHTPIIISAYWWMPLDVSAGDEVTMFAEVENVPVGAQCTFKIFEDDVFDDDEIDPPYPTGRVYQADDGRTYVKATWTAQWQNDGGINPWAGDPEYFFEVSYGSASLLSSRSPENRLIVRETQQPSTVIGDFAYWDNDTGEATRESTPLTDGRIPIILVHGMGGDAKYDSLNYWYGWANGDIGPMNSQLGRFNKIDMKSKFKVYRYVYDSSRNIGANGSEFAQFVVQYYQQHPELAERQFVIMAHSMGGLVSRYALNTNSDFRDKIHRLITLGTPHLGSPLANPTWIREAYPDIDYAGFVLSTLYDALRITGKVEGHPGFFDLAWYDINDIPTASRKGMSHYLWLLTHPGLYDETLLDNSLTNPFCGSENMIRQEGDSQIIAYGGYSGTKIHGDGENWPETVAEEVEDDHNHLLLARNILYPMAKQDGSIIGNNDGLVPLSSALLGSGHANSEKIDLTDSFGEEIDHAAYLDVGSTMDIVADRLNTMVKVSISPQAAAEDGTRWRIAGGAWQKSGVSLNALKPGQYTIEFKDVSGWHTPANRTISIYNGQTTTTSGTYMEIPRYSVFFTAGANGTLTGNTVQTVKGGENCTAVEAVPAHGFSFIAWSGDYTGTENPLTITNVTSDMNITANFDVIPPPSYTVTFSAGSNGYIAGETTQTVNANSDCAAVEAVPAHGFSFIAWSGDYTGTENPLTITNVTSDMNITANFDVIPPPSYTVTFSAGSNGYIAGETTQTVSANSDCAAVEAVPANGFRFIAWSGDYTGTENPLTIANVTSDMNITANFIRPPSYTVAFSAGSDGSIAGETTQIITAGSDCAAVEAVPDNGCSFIAWRGDYTGTENPLTITNVTFDMNITAEFGQCSVKTRNAMPWLMLLLSDDSPPTTEPGDPWRVVLAESGTDNSEVNFMSVAFNGSQVTATDLCESVPPIYGTLSGSDITISFTTGSGVEIEMTGTLFGDTMTGTAAANGYLAGTWQAQKLNQAPDPKTCVTDTAEAICFYFPWSDSFGIEAFLRDQNFLVQSAVISGSYISGTSPLTYNLNRDGVWQTDPNPVISYGMPPSFPLYYNVHVVFKDSTTADIPFTISGYETAEGD